MSACSQTNTPVLNTTTDPCNGVHTSTACIFKEDAITYLNVTANSNLDTILQNIVLALQASNARITELEDQVEQLQADLLACCPAV